MSDSRPGWHVAGLLLFASSLTVMAGAILSPALPRIEDHFLAIDGDAERIALKARLLLTLHGLAIACCGALAGFLVDRVGRHIPLVVGVLLYAFFGSSGLWLSDLDLLLASRIGLGAAVAVIMTASTALIGDCFHGEARQQLIGRQSTAMAGGGIVYLACGGLLAEVSWRAPFAIYLLPLPLAALIFLVPGHRSGRRGLDDDLKESAAPWIKLIGVYALAFIGMASFYLVPVQVPAQVERHFGLPPIGSAGFIAANTFVSASVAFFYARLSRGRAPLGYALCGLLVMGLGYLITASLDNPWVVFAGLSAAGFGLGMVMPNHVAWISRLAPERMRGRALGMLTAVLFLGQFCSPMLSEALRRSGGFSLVFAAVGAALVLMAVIGLAFGRLGASRV